MQTFSHDGFEFETDEYGTVLPTAKNAVEIVVALRQGKSVLVALYLGASTMKNVLFALPTVGRPANAYRLNQMVVAVDRCSMYQFDLTGGVHVAPGYIEEKLRLGGANSEVMARFINDMRRVAMIKVTA